MQSGGGWYRGSMWSSPVRECVVQSSGGVVGRYKVIT